MRGGLQEQPTAIEQREKGVKRCKQSDGNGTINRNCGRKSGSGGYGAHKRVGVGLERRGEEVCGKGSGAE
jgi:hypothetical protein